MCGRLTLTTNKKEKVHDLVPDAVVAEWMGGRYNLAPSLAVPTLRQTLPPEVSWLTWGLIPAWAKDPAIASKLINARAETVAEKPAFRSAFRERRCLVFADGYYEWKAGPSPSAPKIPFYFHFPQRALFAIAGLWETWTSPEGARLETCTLITKAANAWVGEIHHRMPAILEPKAIPAWLDPATSANDLHALLRPAPHLALQRHSVSTRVNRAGQEGPELIEPIEPPLQQVQIELF